MMPKGQLAIQLSKLKDFTSPKIILEQYLTPSNSAAQLLWSAYMLGDIEGKTVTDLGAGTGILGIAAILLGAKKVFFVENDDHAIIILKENLAIAKISKNKFQIIHNNVEEINHVSDVVIQNPPFGTKQMHNDRLFLQIAFRIANVIYSLHKTITDEFIQVFSKDNSFIITHLWKEKINLSATYVFHKKKVQPIFATWYRFSKKIEKENNKL